MTKLIKNRDNTRVVASQNFQVLTIPRAWRHSHIRHLLYSLNCTLRRTTWRHRRRGSRRLMMYILLLLLLLLILVLVLLISEIRSVYIRGVCTQGLLLVCGWIRPWAIVWGHLGQYTRIWGVESWNEGSWVGCVCALSNPELAVSGYAACHVYLHNNTSFIQMWVCLFLQGITHVCYCHTTVNSHK